MSKAQRLALAALFAFSGATALVYEVVWMRLFGLMVGHTTYGLTTVLAAFMAGLGLGGWLGGRLAERGWHPLRAYAALEALIAVAGVTLGPLLYSLDPLFGWVYRLAPDDTWILTGLRFLVCGAVLLVPTVLMGMTLPVLSALVADRDGKVGWDVGWLYAANTAGAALGSLSCGFVLLPALGMTRTTLTAAAFNVVIVVVALLLARAIPWSGRETRAGGGSGSAPAGEASFAARVPRWVPGAALAALGVSAASAMAHQVAWVRAIGLAIGSTTYAFTLIVSSFILGLALGAAWFGRAVDRSSRPVRLLGFSLAGAALSCLVMLPLLGRFPVWVVTIYAATGGEHAKVLLAEAVCVFALFVLPTFFMGGAFPLVARLLTPRFSTVGRSVGEAYAASTGGSILGALVAGFVLVPTIGARATSLGAAVVTLVAGLAFLAVPPAGSDGSSRRWLVPAAVAVAGVLLVTLPPGWHPGIINSGPYVNSGRILTAAARQGVPIEQVMREQPLAWWREGVDDTVAVGRNPGGGLFMTVNGKPDASSDGDKVTMVLQGHLPLFLHPDPKSALVIGFGSGLTSGSVALHDLESIDAAEISDGVIEAARLYFTETNRGVLDDPRLRLLMGDARTTVGHGRGTYDVISSQPSNLYMVGVPELFTVEFFELCRDRLAPGGVMGQWIHAYNLSPEDFRTVVRTFAEVFPGVSLWDAHLGSDFLLIGTLEGDGAPPVDIERLEQLFAVPEIAADLERIGTRDPAEFLGWFVAEGDAVRAFVGPGPVNTVDRNILEFSVPRSMRLGPGLEILRAMMPLRREEPFDWLRGEATNDVVERANRQRRDTRLFVASEVEALTGNLAGAYRRYEKIDRRDGPVAWRRSREVLTEAMWRSLQRGAYREVASVGRALHQDDPADPQPLVLWASAALSNRRPASARTALERLLATPADEQTLAWARSNLESLGPAPGGGAPRR